MTRPASWRRLRRAARTRRVLIAVAFVIAALPIAAAIGWRIDPAGPWHLGVAFAGVVAMIVAAFVFARRIDDHVVVRRLDAAVPSLEDSSDLVLREPASLNTLQQLQRERLLSRLAAIAPAHVRDPWPIRAIVVTALVALGVGLGIVATPRATRIGTDTPTPTADRAPASTRIVAIAFDVAPPAYTGLPTRRENAPDLQVEQDAAVTWRIRFEPSPREAAVALHDGTRVPLSRAADGDEWLATRAIDAAVLYGFAIGADDPPLVESPRHRIDVIADRPPEVRVISPDRTLTVLDAAQSTWPLAFEAADDYGLGDVRLIVTLAQGSGENIAVSERSIALRGEGDARARRYRHSVDLGALGFAQGDDAIVRLVVRDRRAPRPNETRSASFILRWPPAAANETTGMEGLVQRALPAYFRSQRQIIIDTEALLAEAPRLAADAVTSRADTIGVDQRTLRLRYGQFLGEEAAEPSGDHADGDAHAHDEGDAHAHDDGEAPAAAPFGSAIDVLNTVGHAHDIPEAATLLDPATRETLRAALNAMWQAELHLRSGRPKAALPHEHEALRQIKLVQQATRIYLARVGLELPPIDPARRLTGDRAGLADRRDPLPAARDDDAVIRAAWQALASGAAPDHAAVVTWLREHGDDLADPLTLQAALDEARAKPDCAPCREALRVALWPLLDAPPASVAPRAAGDRRGEAYLDALERLP